jgi:hypothetical protein
VMFRSSARALSVASSASSFCIVRRKKSAYRDGRLPEQLVKPSACSGYRQSGRNLRRRPQMAKFSCPRFCCEPCRTPVLRLNRIKHTPFGNCHTPRPINMLSACSSARRVLHAVAPYQQR